MSTLEFCKISLMTRVMKKILFFSVLLSIYGYTFPGRDDSDREIAFLARLIKRGFVLKSIMWVS